MKHRELDICDYCETTLIVVAQAEIRNLFRNKKAGIVRRH